MTAPCSSWVGPSDILAARPNDVANLDQALLTLAGTIATDILFSLSGRQFTGQCTRTIRPTARPIGWTPSSWINYVQSLSGSGWNSTWGICQGGDHDGCGEPPQIDLGTYPVTSIVQVRQDGVVVPSTEYRVDGAKYLVRQRTSVNAQPTGAWGWRTCQDLTLPASEPGTLEVTFTFGDPPPPSGKNAAAVFAAEIALDQSGKDSQLPSRVTSITRQGVSMTILDPMQFLQEGGTGIYIVDQFIRAFNPGKQRIRPSVYSPDLGRRRHTTTA